MMPPIGTRKPRMRATMERVLVFWPTGAAGAEYGDGAGGGVGIWSDIENSKLEGNIRIALQ
jgi:hypothetical protein